MFNIFKKKDKVEEQCPELEEFVVYNMKSEIIPRELSMYSMSLTDLHGVTQNAKQFMNYDSLTNGEKYLIEKYQDIILHYARNLPVNRRER